jgi:hypothetical protein
MESKKTAADKYRHRFLGSVSKLKKLQIAYELAQNVPYEIHRQLIQGAGFAFVQEKQPDNLQTILADPGPFPVNKNQHPSDLVAEILLALLARKEPTPETLDLALATVDVYKKQRLLSDTLYFLFDREKNYLSGHDSKEIERTAALLLKAGACAQGYILAFAMHNFSRRGEDSSAIENMLVRNGASYEAAIHAMRDCPLEYSKGEAERLELILALKKIAHLEDRNKQLAETIGELTGQGPAQPAPAAEKTPAASAGKPGKMRTVPITL